MNIQELKFFIRVYEELKKISRSLHHQDENACNYGLTSRQEKRVENLEKKAQKLANELNLKAYHQGDPRGLSLWLITDEMNETNYHQGIPIYF